MAADRSRRHIETARGRRKISGLRDLDKDGHCDMRVHDNFPVFRDYISRN
jgi:hypothetical protein